MSTAVQSLVFWSLWRSSRTILNSARELPYGEQIGSQTCCRKHRSGSNQGHTETSLRTRLQRLVQTQHTSSSLPSAHLAGVFLRERNSGSKSRKTFRCKLTERELGFRTGLQLDSREQTSGLRSMNCFSRNTFEEVFRKETLPDR